MQYRREPIVDFPLYQIDTNGIVYGQRGKILSTFENKKGYVLVPFCINNHKYAKQVHRLMAKQFLQPPQSYNMQVNHLDGNKKNNHVENLEWATQEENIQHAKNVLHVMNGNGNNRKICAKNKNGYIIYTFSSIIEAARFFCKDECNLRCCQNSIWRALNKIRKTYHGYIWEYIDI